MGIFVPGIVLLPIAYAIKKYPILDKALKVIFLYLLTAGITNVIAAVLAFNNKNNLFLLHAYSAIEFALLSIYFFLLVEKLFVKQLILSIIVLYVIYCLLNVAFVQRIDQFNTYTRSIQAIMISGYSLYYLYTGIGNFVSNRKKGPHYWIALGLITYFMSSLVQFSFSNFFSTYFTREIKFWLWNFHATMVLLMYLFFFKAYAICKE
ncbi:hypothetical protein RYH73_09030 [Olivibacter sp. CPCC 100613]